LCALVAGGDAVMRPDQPRQRPHLASGALSTDLRLPGSLVLEDDAIVTITGASLGDNGDPRRAAAIRWRLSEALGGEFVGLQPVEGP